MLSGCVAFQGWLLPNNNPAPRATRTALRAAHRPGPAGRVGLFLMTPPACIPPAFVDNNPNGGLIDVVCRRELSTVITCADIHGSSSVDKRGLIDGEAYPVHQARTWCCREGLGARAGCGGRGAVVHGCLALRRAEGARRMVRSCSWLPVRLVGDPTSWPQQSSAEVYPAVAWKTSTHSPVMARPSRVIEATRIRRVSTTGCCWGGTWLRKVVTRAAKVGGCHQRSVRLLRR